MRQGGWVACGIAAWALAAGSAAADVFANGPEGEVYLVRTKQKEVRRLGRIGTRDGERIEHPETTDIAFHPKQGLYAIGFYDLYRVDPEDPSRSKRVGGFGGPRLNAAAFDEDGTLYAAGDTGLHRIDLATGRATLVGEFGTGWLGSDGDLAFHRGVLYATLLRDAGSTLVRLDPKTGKPEAPHALRLADGTRLYGAYGLADEPTRLLVLLDDGRVLEVDPATGIATEAFAADVVFWGASRPLVL